MANSNTEVWLSGPIAGVPALLQPVAHALLQAKDEINELMKDFPDEGLWEKPVGVASVGFHLQHIVGVLERLFTYAAGKHLSEEQLQYLLLEGRDNGSGITVSTLLARLNDQIETTLVRLKSIREDTLTDVRTVGRKQLPSTVLGLIFHSAEHTMRHLGQLLVTVRYINQKAG